MAASQNTNTFFEERLHAGTRQDELGASLWELTQTNRALSVGLEIDHVGSAVSEQLGLHLSGLCCGHAIVALRHSVALQGTKRLHVFVDLQNNSR